VARSGSLDFFDTSFSGFYDSQKYRLSLILQFAYFSLYKYTAGGAS
jgi:hypothetical protein